MLGFWERLQSRFYTNFNNTLNVFPASLGNALALICTTLAMSFYKGNAILVAVCLFRQFEIAESSSNEPDVVFTQTLSIDDSSWLSLERYWLKDLPFYTLSSLFISLAIYMPVGIFFQWYFYYRLRENSADWKLQPGKFLTWEEQKSEISLGLSSITIGSLLASVFTCYFNNEGPYSKLYFDIEQMGILYYLFSFPALFLTTDLLVYYAHRVYHTPYMYRRIHKYHHKYKYPTPFSATAMHPVEICTYELLSYVPIFLMPIHWSVFSIHAVYVFYYNIEAHCGINLKKSIWPWMPPVIFHDNHHQYTHYNFGSGTFIWDIIHGTYRIKTNDAKSE